MAGGSSAKATTFPSNLTDHLSSGSILLAQNFDDAPAPQPSQPQAQAAPVTQEQMEEAEDFGQQKRLQGPDAFSTNDLEQRHAISFGNAYDSGEVDTRGMSRDEYIKTNIEESFGRAYDSDESVRDGMSRDEYIKSNMEQKYNFLK